MADVGQECDRGVSPDDAHQEDDEDCETLLAWPEEGDLRKLRVALHLGLLPLKFLFELTIPEVRRGGSVAGAIGAAARRTRARATRRPSTCSGSSRT